MGEKNIRIDYKRFNSFLKDYLRMLGRGWLFLQINENYSKGDIITFNFNISGLDMELKARGKVIYCGCNDKGNEGFGLEMDFDKSSSEYLKNELPEIITGKFGDYTGLEICSFLK